MRPGASDVVASTPSLGAWLCNTEAALRAGGIEAPRIQARAILGHVLGLETAQVLARLGDPLSPATVAQLEGLVQRRLAHEPLQYVVGKAHFLDFEVSVAPGVFIPRPETEQLVGRALQLWEPNSVAIDLCSGSGAIAIALARARPAASIIAVERSEVAMRHAAASATRAGVADRIVFLRADLLTALRPQRRPRIGLLACNPPYAATGDVVQPEVRDYEPRAAWEAGPTGLEAYRRLLPQAAALLPAGASLVLELGYGQEDRVATMIGDDDRWGAPLIEPDFQGIPRVLSVHRV